MHQHEVAARYDPMTAVVVITQDRLGNKAIASNDFRVGEDGQPTATIIEEGVDLNKVWTRWVVAAKKLQAEREAAAKAEAAAQSQE
ncbi:MAG: hypothetical protein ACRENL_01830 [Candidatus Dormibacteria bacterium]